MKQEGGVAVICYVWNKIHSLSRPTHLSLVHKKAISLSFQKILRRRIFVCGAYQPLSHVLSSCSP
jgi:hypothetical protein